MNVITSRKQASKGFFLANVGTSVGALKNAINTAQVEHAFALLGLNAHVLTTFPEIVGGSEETHLVSVYNRATDHDLFLRYVNEVSRSLGQDCIAIWHPVLNEGFLVGPRAEAFGGIFNAEYFQVEAGVTLASLPEAFVAGPKALAEADDERGTDDNGEPLCSV
jgi:hypothetical protein